MMNQLKLMMKMNFNIIKPYIKPASYVIIGLIALYWIIYLFTREPQMPEEYKATIDSLTKANAALAAQQKQLDSSIHVYEAEVEKVDFEIDHIKEKTTVVKEFHHEIIERVNHYDASQIDSFFKIRYNN